MDDRPDLWLRIKEHKLIQASIAYLASALAIAHGQELVGNAYHWPDIIGRVVVAVLGAGFPITIGIVFLRTKVASAASRAALSRVLERILMLVLGVIVVVLVTQRLLYGRAIEPTHFSSLLNVALGLVVVALLADRVHLARPARRVANQLESGTAASASSAPAVAPPPSGASGMVAPPGTAIAVLPFANLSSDKEQEYFSDGLSEELINELAHIKGLRVAARTSAFAFKGKNEDLRVVGEKLSVSCVLEGSVRKAGSRLRITAQLVNCGDGYHLWSETFDRELDDVFAIQSEISRAVARALGAALGIAPREPAGGTRNLQAYETYLRARGMMRLFGPDDVERASQLFREAIALDPEFALAWTGLGESLGWATLWVPQKSASIVPEWHHAVERALAIAPDRCETQLANGIKEFYLRHWSSSERALRRAAELAHESEPEVPYLLAVLLSGAGRVTEALPYLLTARSLDPLSASLSQTLQVALTIAGRDAEADAEYLRGRDLSGNREAMEDAALRRAWSRGATAQELKERLRAFLAHEVVRMPVQSELVELIDHPDEARSRLRAAFEDPAYQDSTRQFRLALWAAQFDDADLALSAARRAYISFGSLAKYVIWMPTFRAVRRDPRFRDFLHELGLPEYWRTSGKWGDFVRPVGAEDFEVIA